MTEQSKLDEEPIAWMREWEGDISDEGNYIFVANEDEKDDSPNWVPLYAAPSKVQIQSAVDKAREEAAHCVESLFMSKPIGQQGWLREGVEYATAIRSLIGKPLGDSNDL